MEERGPDETWIWLEDVREAGPAHWSHSEYESVGYQIGLFNGSYLAGKALPTEPGLGSGWLRSHVESAADAFANLETSVLHPFVAQMISEDVLRGMLRLWRERSVWLDALDCLPQTFCHHDLFRRNLFWNTSNGTAADLVAIDWASAGRGAVGEDLSLVITDLCFFEITPSRAVALGDMVFDSYLRGLAAAGWRGRPA